MAAGDGASKFAPISDSSNWSHTAGSVEYTHLSEVDVIVKLGR